MEIHILHIKSDIASRFPQHPSVSTRNTLPQPWTFQPRAWVTLAPEALSCTIQIFPITLVSPPSLLFVCAPILFFFFVPPLVSSQGDIPGIDPLCTRRSSKYSYLHMNLSGLNLQVRFHWQRIVLSRNKRCFSLNTNWFQLTDFRFSEFVSNAFRPVEIIGHHVFHGLIICLNVTYLIVCFC